MRLEESPGVSGGKRKSMTGSTICCTTAVLPEPPWPMRRSEKRRRRDERIAQQEKRDGHLTKEERVQRMQEVIGRCGIENKACMRELLGQAEGATDEDLVRF